MTIESDEVRAALRALKMSPVVDCPIINPIYLFGTG